jgi:S1-C subfamily serine protease
MKSGLGSLTGFPRTIHEPVQDSLITHMFLWRSNNVQIWPRQSESRGAGFGWPAAFCLLILSTTGLSFPGSAQAQELRDTFRRVKSAVVVVHVVDDNPLAALRAGDDEDSNEGSGVIISGDGRILTAAHVVGEAEAVVVECADGQKISARVVASSILADVALLQLDNVPSSVSAAKLADSDRVEPGDDIFIVGAPYGLSFTLTAGRISARRRNLTSGGILSSVEFFQTDAAINSGNSGGPVFNRAGEVIGIVSGIVTHSGGFEGVGFATTANAVRGILLDRKSFWSDVEGVFLSGEVAAALNLPQRSGFLVMHVSKGSPAESMGLKGGHIEAVVEGEELLLGGDVIEEVNGVAVTGDTGNPLVPFIEPTGFKQGERITCKVLRAGKLIELSTVAKSAQPYIAPIRHGH